jgi:hypothetical protein
MLVLSGVPQETYSFNWQKQPAGQGLRCRGILLSNNVNLRSEDEEGWLWGTNTRLLLAAATFGGLVLSLGGSVVFKALRNRWSSAH